MQVTYIYIDHGLVAKITKSTELHTFTEQNSLKFQEVTKDCVSPQSWFFTVSCQQMLTIPQVKDFHVALSTLQDPFYSF